MASKIKPSSILPTSSQSWGGYWTFITAAILLMFVIFIAGNGLIAQWLALFVYGAPQSPAVAAPSTATSAATSTVASSIGSVLPAANAAADALGLPAGTGTTAATGVGVVGAMVTNPSIGMGVFGSFLKSITGGK